ncbi:hypothetical protein ALP39_200026 [Pseudomonas marginalis pv. marginalis]|nr:hypothetical protein ALP39_200026 [Pseudomonas marginalis pv. marginalis]
MYLSYRLRFALISALRDALNRPDFYFSKELESDYDEYRTMAWNEAEIADPRGFFADAYRLANEAWKDGLQKTSPEASQLGENELNFIFKYFYERTILRHHKYNLHSNPSRISGELSTYKFEDDASKTLWRASMLALGCEAALSERCATSVRSAVSGLGLLRSPAQGKPAHHKGPLRRTYRLHRYFRCLTSTEDGTLVGYTILAPNR